MIGAIDGSISTHGVSPMEVRLRYGGPLGGNRIVEGLDEISETVR
jgi:hypothetical protein